GGGARGSALPPPSPYPPGDLVELALSGDAQFARHVVHVLVAALRQRPQRGHHRVRRELLLRPLHQLLLVRREGVHAADPAGQVAPAVHLLGGHALRRAGLLRARRAGQPALAVRVARRLRLPVLLRPGVLVPLDEALRLVLLLLVHARAVLVAASLLVHAIIPSYGVSRAVRCPRRAGSRRSPPRCGPIRRPGPRRCRSRPSRCRRSDDRPPGRARPGRGRRRPPRRASPRPPGPRRGTRGRRRGPDRRVTASGAGWGRRRPPRGPRSRRYGRTRPSRRTRRSRCTRRRARPHSRPPPHNRPCPRCSWWSPYSGSIRMAASSAE